ncbi:uncharacterized protein C1orf112-like [Belonocnema kinseyi]|uniref:uncharacterized protein C1orf112-like n=1 Tax=Belonocnema kinseyi TaxID=2817044 RepID=UPI00143DC15B|nr:uncharacterized protein C1orf112-like [Belonocnema kinseyi]
MSQSSPTANANLAMNWSKVISDLDSDFKIDSENGDQALLVEKLHKIFDECLPICPVDDLDTRIFSVYLSEANRTITQLIAEINKKLAGKRINEDDIKNKLRICENVLGCWKKCLQHLKDLQKVSVSKIKSFPDLLFNAIKSVLCHCKMSEVNYGDIMKDVTDEVTALFRKSNEIMCFFLTVLDSVIMFDVHQDEEFNLLSTIVSEIGDTATLVNCLDLKSLAEMWKKFGRLATIHSEIINSKSPESVTRHFVSLEEDIMSLIFSAVKGSQKKVNERNILCGRMLFKILDKLWNTYCRSVSNENADSAIKLLVQMYRYSPPCLIATKVDPVIIKFIDTNISIELENFLNTIFRSEHFFKALFEFGKREDADPVGFHLFTLNLLRKLLKLPYEIQKTWIVGELSILDVALANIDLLQLEICLGKLQLQVPRNLGEAPKSMTIYEETLLMIWGLICQVPAADFGAIEQLLVKHLMSGKFWTSLLTTDIWCMIGRVGSSQLCYDHLKYFLMVHEKLSERENSLEVFILSFLISRLYKLLSDNKKVLLVEDIKSKDPDFWYPLSGVLTQKGKSVLRNRIANDVDIKQAYQNLNDKPSVKYFTTLTSMLKMLGIYFEEQDKETMETLSNIWNSVAQVIEDCEGIYLIIVSELMMALFHCEVPSKETFHDGTLSSILKSITSLVPYAPPFVRVKLLYWLQNLALQTIDGSSFAPPISELYAQLLEDKTPWVRQEAFESFDYFTRNSDNEELVERVVKVIVGKPTLSDSITAYIASTPYYKLSGFPNNDAFFRQLIGSPRASRPQHTCYEVNEREEKLLKLEEASPKSSSRLDQKIGRVCDELEEIAKCRNEISPEFLDRLRIAMLKIFDQHQ